MSRLSRRFSLLLLLPLLFAARPAAAQDEAAGPEAAAVEAAEAWLALVDAGDYAGSHAVASPLLKSQVTAEQWGQTIGTLNSQLAALAPAGQDSTAAPVREFRVSEYTTELPNVPAGEYVVVQYGRIVGDVPLVEVVILALDGETWRVAGYFAQPEQQ